jgi:hypothetical protein
MRLHACAGSVCGEGTVLMCHERHQGATVLFGYIEGSFLVSKTGDECERYVPNIYRCIRT